MDEVYSSIDYSSIDYNLASWCCVGWCCVGHAGLCFDIFVRLSLVDDVVKIDDARLSLASTAKNGKDSRLSLFPLS